MKVFMERGNRSVSLRFNGSAKELLAKLGVNPEEVIIVRNGTLVTLDGKLKDSDDVKLLSVISGG